MDTDDIKSCNKCGCVFDVSIVCKEKSKYDTGYSTHTYVGKCPCCKEEVMDER